MSVLGWSKGIFSYIFPPEKWQGEQRFCRIGWICAEKLMVSATGSVGATATVAIASSVEFVETGLFLKGKQNVMPHSRRNRKVFMAKEPKMMSFMAVQK